MSTRSGNNRDIALLAFTFSLFSLALTSDLWRWKCNDLQCVRSKDKGEGTFPSIEVCKLVCGNSGAFWPQPRRISTLSKNLLKFSSIEFTHPENQFLDANVEIFKNRLPDASNCPEIGSVNVLIETTSDDDFLNWSTDESYTLNISTRGEESKVKITASTIYGARHALETLSQMIELFQEETSCLVINTEASIEDFPEYPHRGLLLDSARNFLKIAQIKKHVDAMAASKLNVLHWHVTDSQSFPLELPSLPNMTLYGSYAENKIYRTEDVKDLVLYARTRGVRIVIEIDAPAHAGNGWQWGEEAGLGNLSVCVNQQPHRSFCVEPPCGQLNPTNQNLYRVLEKLYEDVVDLVPGDVFHMGGDEVFIDCWNSTQEIVDYVRAKGRSEAVFLDLWGDYQDQATDVFDKVVGHNRTAIVVWTSTLTQIDIIEKYLRKDRYVIQTWVPADDPLPNDLLNLGYKIIVSTKDKWYLDHGFWGTTLYHNWNTVYDNKIPPRKSGTLGGEVCMWGEYVDSYSVEARVWPRAAAAAERLWTNPGLPSLVAANRFYRHRERLIGRGIHADAIVPEWCYQNEEECD